MNTIDDSTSLNVSKSFVKYLEDINNEVVIGVLSESDSKDEAVNNLLDKAYAGYMKDKVIGTIHSAKACIVAQDKLNELGKELGYSEYIDAVFEEESNE